MDLRKISSKKIKQVILDYESFIQTAGGRVCGIYVQIGKLQIGKNQVLADVVVTDSSDEEIEKTERFKGLKYSLSFFEEHFIGGGKKQ